MSRILLAEDDPSLGAVMVDNLSVAGFEVKLANNGQEAVEKFDTQDFDICILDVMMPKKDGFAVAHHIREKNSAIPILFLTAKSMEEDRLRGFRSGGDDYITKPFSMKELIFRIEVFLKRTTVKGQVKIYAIGTYGFDFDNLELTCQGQTFSLTQKEADVLRFLCENQGRVLKRNDILKAVWNSEDYFLGRSMDVFISKLRKYLQHDPSVKITNIHGVGFRFEIIN